MDFSLYDYVIIDTSIDDGAFVGWGALAIDDVLANVRWLCRTALRAGCAPVILCMPNRRHLDNTDPALPAYRQVADEFRIPMLDGYEFVHATAVETGEAPDGLFKDDLHLLPEVSTRMAPDLIALCRPATPHIAELPSPAFRCILAPDLALPMQERRTSLMAAHCAELSRDACLEVELGEDESVAGVVYNAGHTFGSLIFDGTEKAAVNVRSDYYQKHDLVAAARQVSPAVRAQQGVVRLYMQHGSGNGVEIIGLVVRSA